MAWYFQYFLIRVDEPLRVQLDSNKKRDRSFDLSFFLVQVQSDSNGFYLRFALVGACIFRIFSSSYKEMIWVYTKAKEGGADMYGIERIGFI